MEAFYIVRLLGKKSQEKLSFLYRALSFSWFYDEIHVVR